MKNLYQNKDIKILVVDDNPQNIQIIGQNLMEQGFKVSYAINGAEALKILKSDPTFDLILLDILMPGIDGFEVCKQIKSNPAYDAISIIFLTARSDSNSVIQGLKLGANDYISKPFNAEELLLRVKTQVELKKQREKLEHVNQELEIKVNEKTTLLRQANERLGILEKSKSDFLKLVSHEMRTPLNIINGFTELLSESLQGTEYAEDLADLKNYSDKLISLAETALLITEIQLGKYTLDFEEIDLYLLCEKATEKCVLSYPDTNITYYNHIKPKTSTIKGDGGLLLNIVTKITENAIIACKKGVEISFRTTEDDQNVRLEINDNGPGFSEGDLGRLFEIFAKEGPSESHNGFGLGLATVKLVLDLHSGEVQIKNSPQGGASVSLVFNKMF